MNTLMPENIQKLLIPGKIVRDPRKKAMPSVTEVIVIDGPACIRPRLNRSSADKCIGI